MCSVLAYALMWPPACCPDLSCYALWRALCWPCYVSHAADMEEGLLTVVLCAVPCVLALPCTPCSWS